MSTATSELTSIDVSTGAETVRSLPGSRLPLSREFVDDYIDRELSSEPVDENGVPIPGNLGWAEYGQRLRATPYPDSLPAFDQGIVDSQGWLWLRPYQLPSDTIATWVVLASTSPAVQHISLSSQFHPFEIGPDYVAGVDFGSLGVETVKVFALTRSAAAVPR